ncbi:MAG TPA: hypothetical protein VGX28_06425 [Frankiaceae bacterium]|jgi:hypothetical protein|nr:hypothetical protein [Frankiaceae bacterium]
MRRALALALVAASFAAVPAVPASAGILCPYTVNAVWRPVFGENLCYA